MTDHELLITLDDLPIRFTVKYLGQEAARGLWGLKHTRAPVDKLVGKAKDQPSKNLIAVDLEVSVTGVVATKAGKGKTFSICKKIFPVETISYGVQDLVYTRVFSMITVNNDKLKDEGAFECHSFVCDSRSQARKITFALAAIFQEYGNRLKKALLPGEAPPKRFAIDMRTPEQQANDYEDETDA